MVVRLLMIVLVRLMLLEGHLVGFISGLASQEVVPLAVVVKTWGPVIYCTVAIVDELTGSEKGSS